MVGELQTRFMPGTQGATSTIVEGLIQPSIPAKQVESTIPMNIISKEKTVAYQPELSSLSVDVSMNNPTSRVICNFCYKEGHRR